MRIIRFLQVNFAVVWKNSESMDICFNPERSWIGVSKSIKKWNQISV